MFEGHRKRAEKVRGYFTQKRAITLFAILAAIALLVSLVMNHQVKETDADSFSILSDGIRQLIPGIVSFEPDEITLSDGRSKVYDIRVQEKHNSKKRRKPLF